MRLTCPNCGADYDVPEGMVPAAGRHVQCSACHTRWFVRGTARTPASEDQILTRLENWRPRPVAVPTPDPASGFASGPASVAEASPAMEATAADARSRPAQPLRVVRAPEPEATEDVATGPREPTSLAPARGERPTKPAERPTVARPAPVPDAAARPAPRLALDRARGERLSGPAPEPAPEPAPHSRFLTGFLLVLALALAAFGAYRFDDEIAAAVPSAGPALDTYATAVDGWRAGIEEIVRDFRDRPGGG